MNTHHIHINGIVQGLGIRPLVYRLACELNLHGCVSNGGDGVHILVNGQESVARNLLQQIRRHLPPQARITSASIYKTDPREFDSFSIVIDQHGELQKKAVLMSPDLALCPQCRQELHDPQNRRYRYPFITCTHCGPRYSIVLDLPFERFNTAMKPFVPCAHCRQEYEDVEDRRFYSQTNSCPDCPVQLQITDPVTRQVFRGNEDILRLIKQWLKEDEVIALKGIGGYLLLCTADSPSTIQRLRSRKHRPAKPFALLYPSLELINQHYFVSEKEKELLTSPEAPIVLLYPKPAAWQELATSAIAPGLQRLGVMLPYSPLLELVAGDFGQPLVATSGNISGSPIVYKEEDAHLYLQTIADHVVDFDREITIPEDDSVVQVSTYYDQPILLRRSRGYAPSFTYYQPQHPVSVLATGAMMKNSFTLSVNENVFVSQFLGSGDSYESQQMYKATLQHWLQMYQAKPRHIAADLHPDYFTHQYAVSLAGQFNAGLQFVQHHEAHFAAVLAENDLLDSHEPILGVIWDGTGYGHDGQTWGGEFLVYHYGTVSRHHHFEYFPVVAGDKMAKEPRIAALSALRDFHTGLEIVRKKFSSLEWKNYLNLANSGRNLTSSVGRMFDAVASLLDLCDKQSYEGEAALALQVKAEAYVSRNGFEQVGSYLNPADMTMPTILEGIIHDLRKGRDRSLIAAKFHRSLAETVGIVANSINASSVCFSGGVFQNSLLVDWIHRLYDKELRLYFHRQLSPNDENISFGQFVFHDRGLVSANGNQFNKNKQKVEEQMDF